MNITIYVHSETICVHFPTSTSGEMNQAVVRVLEKAGFVQGRGKRIWERARTDFWVEQCRKLATKLGIDLVHYKAKGEGGVNNAKLFEKIKKLLALSSSPNENEAALAASKASELLAEHNLSMADLNGLGDEEVEELRLDSLNNKKWKTCIAEAIAANNYCEIFISHCGKNKTLMLVGKPVNILGCQQMYEYLVSTVERLCRQETRGATLSYKNAFLNGCAHRLYRRLKEDIATQDEKVGAAIVLKSQLDKENQYYLNRNYPQMSITKTRSGSYDAEGYRAGRAAGDGISLGKQIGGQRRLGRG